MNKESLESDSKVEKGMENGRRSVLKKIGIAAPAIITLTSRPSYGAGFCSLSGFASVSPSGVIKHRNQRCGLSHGGWKTPYAGAGTWPVGCVPNPQAQYMHNYSGQNGFLAAYNSATPPPGNVHPFTAARIIAGTTPYNGVFDLNKYDPRPNNWPSDLVFSLHDAMLYGDKVGREAATALLNAKEALVSTDPLFENFHFTEDQVISLFNDLEWGSVSFTSHSDVADFFEAPHN